MRNTVSSRQCINERRKPFIHLHVSYADHNFNAVGGHLFSGIVSMTIELVIVPMSPGLVRKPVGGVFWQMDS